MANKFKLFVGFLALIALFSVYSFLNSLPNKTISTTVNNTRGTLSFTTVDNDADHDGLTNRDESYWNTDFQNPDTDGDGFLDGEEVSSSHDPLIPAPNDLIDNKNLTTKFSNLTLSGLYGGSLSPKNSDYAVMIGNIASVITENAVENLDTKIKAGLPTISSTKQNQEIYINQVSPLIESVFSDYIFELNKISKDFRNSSVVNSDDSLVEFFKEQSKKYQKHYNTIITIYPPKNWQENHFGFLKLLGDLSQVHLAISRNNTDPITALVAMNRLNSLLEMIPKIMISYAEKIKDEKIKTESTIFHK